MNDEKNLKDIYWNDGRLGIQNKYLAPYLYLRMPSALGYNYMLEV
jgi:hypothetical protein